MNFSAHRPPFSPLVLVVLAIASLAPAACRRDPAPAAADSAAAHAAAVEEWRAKRDGRLRSEDGWLSLVGLYWLQPGENRFGSAPDNQLVFPAAAPPLAGSLVVDGSRVTLRAQPGAGLT